MKMEIALLVGAESKKFLADLTTLVERMEAAVSEVNDKADSQKKDASEEEDEEVVTTSKKTSKKVVDEDEDDEDFTSKKKTTKKSSSFDEDDEIEEKPAAKKAKKITIDDVNDACKAKAKDTDRDTVLAILKKKFKVDTVTKLKPEQYADVIEALEV